ncbi:endonuclease YncB(thermonuclease family) [Nitrobacteraceae bacterium AZCC 2146]
MKYLTLVTLLCAVELAAAGDLVGQASVIDGDTIEIHGTRVRLFGIDAPESDQTCHDDDGKLYRCGQKAANELSAFIGAKTVSCIPQNTDRYGRTVAICSASSVDLADWLVRGGLALDWRQYSKGKYADAQKAAERSGDGMWGGQWVEPWRYRECVRSGGKAASCSESATPAISVR